MKFRLINLGYRQTPDYPYDYRIELTEYTEQEREQLTLWLQELKIPHIIAGWNIGSVIYIKNQDAVMFRLKWS